MYGISSAVRAVVAGLIANDHAMNSIFMMKPTSFSKTKRRRTGKQYPHSSARQQARYARQLAAGQIRFSA